MTRSGFRGWATLAMVVSASSISSDRVAHSIRVRRFMAAALIDLQPGDGAPLHLLACGSIWESRR